ncbi:formate dehydrogenase subunit gamma [Ideonella sp. A 288]|uniref:formate dehydrogenase subunit gamma n=1 Tax=Ideonella sp. A 288 TaxID=1962181 RepID=UPI000B4BDA66|nr:formate dehydrogenase subunit gamma [Ideonella sp. A 288]
MSQLISRMLRPLGLAAVLWLAAVAAQAQSSPPADAAVAAPNGPPAGFVAPTDPKPDESNAQRSKTQPGNNAPFWRSVRESGNREGVTNLPGAEKGTLIQPFLQYPGSRFTTAGEAWRQVRNQWILPYGGALLFITVLALALFYWRKGPLGRDHADTGRMIERFTPLERAAHWSNASAFVVLAVSGIVMAFGKFLLLPVMGSTLFGWLTYALKTAHNFVGPLFAVSLIIVVVTFVKDNIASASDFVWLSKGGGMLGDEEIPSHRFNAAEKGIFWWGMCIPGLVSIGSGLVLNNLIPGVGDLRGDMQIAHMIHSVSAILLITALLGHIYMGTIGTRGAYKGMRTGYVNEGWAKEHHALWYQDVQAGKIPAKRSAEPAPALGPATPQA